MRLTAKDINALIEDSAPQPITARSAEDYLESNGANRLRLIQDLSNKENQSSPRNGERLPPPPKSLRSHIAQSNDFGIDPTAHAKVTTATTVGLENAPYAPVVSAFSEEYDGFEEQAQNALIPAFQPPAPSNHPLMPRALFGAVLDQIKSRAELLYAITQNLPLNEMHLPRMLYRTDLLDPSIYYIASADESSDDELRSKYKAMQENLDTAIVHLSYVEGFPALPDNSPLWAKLPWESQEAFSTFLEYCELPGARQTSKLNRTAPQETTLQWFHENYWAVRSKCFDMMHAVHLSKLREQRILTAEDRHFAEGEKIFAKLNAIQSDVNWDLLKDDPKEYINTLEKVIKLQRLALGMPTTSTQLPTTQSQTETVEAAFKKITHAEAPAIRSNKNNELSVRSLLKQSPDTLATAQELIVRMTKTTTSHNAQQNAPDEESQS